MSFKPLDLMEPEETVGNLWHDMAEGVGVQPIYPDAAVELSDIRKSLAVLFRALGGDGAVEIAQAPARVVQSRRRMERRFVMDRDKLHLPTFDGERLRLPPQINCFDERQLNRAAYFWLTALAAGFKGDGADLPENSDGSALGDKAQITANAVAAERAYAMCPGLRSAYDGMRAQVLKMRPSHTLPAHEAALEQAVRDQLSGRSTNLTIDNEQSGPYHPMAPVPIWLTFGQPGSGSAASDAAHSDGAPPAAAAQTSRKLGFRKDMSEADRKDSFIMHRFESILSWVESMNINRSVDDDDDENAQKAAEDQDTIALSKHNKRAATRLRLHLDLSPADAERERLAGKFLYPEWDHRTGNYMPDHCRILETDAIPDETPTSPVNQRRIEQVRRQFEALRPRRVMRPRQIDGTELDLDALITAQVELRATGRSSDRIFQSSRQIERDIAVAFLIDTSRSTEASVGDTSVIQVSRDALSALAGGIDAAGDALGIWGFSSLRRDRVFVTRCKGFETPMSADVTAKICGLQPGHYTRLGAAIRHVSAALAQTQAARRLLIVLTDGKPNDLDHYEGQHGIEDSHMAVREARRAGQSVHGVIIDEDGQDWFARIFGRGGFTLLPYPERLIQALPDMYRALTQET